MASRTESDAGRDSLVERMGAGTQSLEGHVAEQSKGSA